MRKIIANRCGSGKPSDPGKRKKELLPSARKTGTFKEKELFGGLSLKALADKRINIFISFTTPVLGTSEVPAGDSANV